LVGLAAKIFSFWKEPNPFIATLFMMLVVGLISAFINNTATVAVFIPIAIKLAQASKLSRKQMLMPLSFAAIFGGACTLIGTSTNILVNSIFVSRGFSGFSMFEFATVGCTLAAIGTVYMMTVGRGLLKSVADTEESIEPPGYLTEVVLNENSPSVGKCLHESPFYQDFERNIVSMTRNTESQNLSGNPSLKVGDTFLLICNIDKIVYLKDRTGISILKNKIHSDAMPKGMKIYEVVVPANSDLVGHRIQQSGLVRLRGIIPLAVRHGEKALFRLFNSAVIRAGDVLVVASHPDVFKEFQHEESLLVLTEVNINRVDWIKIGITAFLTLGLIVVSSLGLVNVLGAALIVVALLILTKTISLKQAYESLDSQVLILLSCMISLGFAFEKSGGAGAIAHFLVQNAGVLGPYFIISILYLATSFLTEVMSNNATAVLMAPIAIDISNAMNLGPKPFLVAVMMAGSASFMTPVGYQTNTLIYAPGGYKFLDFLKVGTPLNVLFWIAATFLIPILIPF
jgi:di/tricarboxylate transporter